eukprot:TRINITY_DN2769_c0_g1_i2.p1 TRINITY_DN2769_c0_g1~~TRINITY_DN2769_c0_g1_i2.p1  ORF type:complete len:742 (+),score=88.65 TRINITY_DN2769_c0_g1_i2:243-2468(+)
MNDELLDLGGSSDDEDDVLRATMRNLRENRAKRAGSKKLLALQASDSGSKRLSIDRALSVAAMLSLFLMVLENSLVWYMGSTLVIFNTSAGILRVPTDDYHLWVFYTVYVIKGTIAALAIFAVVLLAQYYALLLKDKRTEWSRNLLRKHNTIQDIVHCQSLTKAKRQSYSMLYSSLSLKFGAEVAVHMLYPYPWLSTTSLTFYHFLQIGMFLRLYLLFRLLHTSSAAFKKRFQIRRFYEEFRRMNWQVKWQLSLKILFYEHSIRMVLICVGVTLFIGSFAVFLLERKSPNPDGGYDFAQLQDCVWFTFVTFTTIGYGDMFPRTTMGRMATVVIAVFGQIILAVFGGVVTNKLAPSKQQQLIQSYLKTDTGERGYTEAAALLIQSVWRAGRDSRRRHRERSGFLSWVDSVSDSRVQHKQNKIYAAVKQFKWKRSTLVQAQLQAGDPVVDQKLDKLSHDVDELRQMMVDVLSRLDGNLPTPQVTPTVSKPRVVSSGVESLRKLSKGNLGSSLTCKWTNTSVALPADLAGTASSGGASDGDLRRRPSFEGVLAQGTAVPSPHQRGMSPYTGAPLLPVAKTSMRPPERKGSKVSFAKPNGGLLLSLGTKGDGFGSPSSVGFEGVGEAAGDSGAARADSQPHPSEPRSPLSPVVSTYRAPSVEERDPAPPQPQPQSQTQPRLQPLVTSATSLLSSSPLRTGSPLTTKGGLGGSPTNPSSPTVLLSSLQVNPLQNSGASVCIRESDL